MLKRFGRFLGDVDRALMCLLGGRAYQSLSGSTGRACGFADGQVRWWGPEACWLIEIQPWFGKGHCKRWAEEEAVIEKALAQAGLADL